MITPIKLPFPVLDNDVKSYHNIIWFLEHHTELKDEFYEIREIKDLYYVVLNVETWKVIPSYSKYEASDFGRIRNIKTGKVLRANCNYADGRYRVCIRRNDGQLAPRLVHRLCAMAFLDNPSNLPLVLHNDGDPKHNLIENLRWGTVQDNAQDRVEHGRSGKDAIYVPKETTLDAFYLRRCGLKLREIAEYYNKSIPTVRKWVMHGMKFAESA